MAQRLTDPITFAADQIGRYAVHINANDVAVMGARPLWFFAVMLLPENGTTPVLAETIMGDVRTACEELGVTLAYPSYREGLAQILSRERG